MEPKRVECIETIASITNSHCNKPNYDYVLSCISKFTGKLKFETLCDHLFDNGIDCFEMLGFIEVLYDNQSYQIHINELHGYIVIMSYSDTICALAVMSINDECSCQSLTELMDFSEDSKPIPEFHNIEATAIANALKFSDSYSISDYEINFIKSSI